MGHGRPAIPAFEQDLFCIALPSKSWILGLTPSDCALPSKSWILGLTPSDCAVKRALQLLSVAMARFSRSFWAQNGCPL